MTYNETWTHKDAATSIRNDVENYASEADNLPDSEPEKKDSEFENKDSGFQASDTGNQSSETADDDVPVPDLVPPATAPRVQVPTVRAPTMPHIAGRENSVSGRDEPEDSYPSEGGVEAAKPEAIQVVEDTPKPEAQDRKERILEAVIRKLDEDYRKSRAEAHRRSGTADAYCEYKDSGYLPASAENVLVRYLSPEKYNPASELERLPHRSKLDERQTRAARDLGYRVYPDEDGKTATIYFRETRPMIAFFQALEA